jgi:non-haem Fe2+, alpha-ketoglutarate-dependent halogenase
MKQDSSIDSADPTFEELDALGRDLRFYQTVNDAPRFLARPQIEQFNRDGFVNGLAVFDQQQVVRLRSFVEHVQAREMAAGGDPNFIRFVHLRYATGWDILTNRRIVDCVTDLLGDNVIGWGSAFFIKPPRDSAIVAWHQDASYWPLSPSRTVTVWIAIDDADTENATMQFVIGSHHHGAATFRPSTPEEHNVLNQTIDNPEQYGTGVFDNCLKAGEASIHSDLLLHGSGANASARRRCGLTLRYAASEVRAASEWSQRGVWVSGADTSGHWANCRRPDSDVL